MDLIFQQNHELLWVENRIKKFRKIMVLYSINNLTFINLTATLNFNPLKYSGPKYVLPTVIGVYGVAAKIVDSTKQRSSLAHKHWAEFPYN
jgi:hypothetical protein